MVEDAVAHRRPGRDRGCGSRSSAAARRRPPRRGRARRSRTAERTSCVWSWSWIPASIAVLDQQRREDRGELPGQAREHRAADTEALRVDRPAEIPPGSVHLRQYPDVAIAIEERFPRPSVMGVVNVTPDSFSDGGVNLDPDDAAATARRMHRGRRRDRRRRRRVDTARLRRRLGRRGAAPRRAGARAARRRGARRRSTRRRPRSRGARSRSAPSS